MWLWVVLLFLAGMALILAEFFIPGGICGVLGGILVITSCGLGCWLAGDGAFWVVLAEGLGVVIVIAAGMLIMSRTRAGRFMILDATQDAAQGWVAWETDESLVGACGQALTYLRPAGIIQVDGKRIDAVSTGEYIARGSRVRIREVHGSRVVVERLEGEQT